MPYRVARVDGHDSETAFTIHKLHDITFRDAAPPVAPQFGSWWLAYCDEDAVGFAGVAKAYTSVDAGYLNRSGVVEDHRGHGLQVRMLRARERYAKRQGWTMLITDTTDNVASANSLIKAGYKLYTPKWPWAFPHSLYWKKDLK